MNIQSETEQETQQHIEKQRSKKMLKISFMMTLSSVFKLMLFFLVFFIVVSTYDEFKESQKHFLFFLRDDFIQYLVVIKQALIFILFSELFFYGLGFFLFIFFGIFFDTLNRIKSEYQLFSPNFHEVELNASALGFLAHNREVLAGIDHIIEELTINNKTGELEKFINLRAFISSALDELKKSQHDDVKSIFSSKRKAIAQFYTKSIHSEMMRSQAIYLAHAFIVHLVMEYARLNKLISACEKKNYHVLFMSFMYQTTDILSLDDEEKKVVYSMIDFSQNKQITSLEKKIRKRIYKQIVSV